MIKICLADSLPVVVKGIESYFENNSNFVIKAIAPNLESLLTALDAEKYTIDTIYNTNKKHFNIAINPNKLIDLLDLDISHLKALKTIYDAIDLKVDVLDKTPNIKVNPDDFTIYTENETENTRLEIASRFKYSITELKKHAHVYIQNVSAGISNVLVPNYRTGNLDFNINWIKNR